MEAGVSTGGEGGSSGAQVAAPVESNVSQSQNASGVTSPQGEGGKEPAGLDSSKAPTAAQAQAIRELAATDMDAVVTVKINGQEKKVAVKDLASYYRLDNAANQKMEEAAKLRKSTDSEKAQFKQDIVRLKGLAKENPQEFVKLFGLDPEQFAEMTLAEKFKLMNMTPAERRAQELEQQLNQYKQAEQKQAEEHKTKAQAASEFQEAQTISNELVAAMNSADWKGAGLPTDKKFTAFIAQEMLNSELQTKAGHRERPLSAAEAAANVKGYVVSLQKMIADQASPEALYNLLGEGNTKKIREYELARVTGKPAPTVNSISRPGDEPASNKQQDRPNKPMSEDEWKAYMRAL